MIVIVDYGLGNLRSVEKSFQRINVPILISRDKDVISEASKLVLPGVGHFAQGMENLEKHGLIEVLNKKVLIDKTPILGICLGMQLMTNYSEEGNVKGLGWVDANTQRFAVDLGDKIKIPHVGWNTALGVKESSFYTEKLNNSQFYFVHSYYVKCNDPTDVLATTNYSCDFHSAFSKDNIYGVQFHPEKSHSIGIQLLTNFSKI